MGGVRSKVVPPSYSVGAFGAFGVFSAFGVSGLVLLGLKTDRQASMGPIQKDRGALYGFRRSDLASTAGGDSA